VSTNNISNKETSVDRELFFYRSSAVSENTLHIFPMDSGDEQEPPRKRARVEALVESQTNSPSSLTSLATPITPPQRKARLQNVAESSSYQASTQASKASSSPAIVRSPFQLTSIQDLPAALNADTVTLKGLLSSPLIAECWEFNYLHDVDFLMEAFDSDIRDLVKVHVIHGFWKQEDGVGLKV
jgi:tyrosyl-DNA phosphodiesterase 1